MAFSYYLIDLLNRHFFLGETLPSPVASPSVPSFALLTGQPGDGGPDDWNEPVGGGYARASSITFAWDATNYILYPSTDVYFPEPSGNWGTVVGLGLYDYNTVGVGNLLFSMPWFASPTGPEVPSYNITTGMRPYFRTAPYYEIKFSIHGREPVNIINGGTSRQYSTVIAQWLGNLAPVPYQRTYNIALGRDLQIDEHGRFTGYWTEVSGTNYQRIAVPSTDWTPFEGVIRNTNEIIFTELAPNDWGWVRDVVLYPTGSPTIPAFWGHLDTPIYIATGMGFSIGPSELTISWLGEAI
jgi:hypothetical protein